MINISGSDELLASVYRHDIVNSLNLLKSARKGEEYDVLGIWELDEEQRDEIYDATSILEGVYHELQNGGSIQNVEREVSTLKEYRGTFEGDIGDRFDQIADISGCLHEYLKEYDSTEDDEITVEEVLMPLEDYDVDISYHGNEEAPVHGDPGLSLVANTIAENGIRHGKEDESYQMWAEVIELPESYEIDVWDNGSGISEDIDRENIFDKDVGKNTGKGLFLAREIVDLFGGSIQISEELEGREGGFGLQMQLNKPSS